MKFLVESEDTITNFITTEPHILISIKSPGSSGIKLPQLKSRVATLFLEFHDFDGDRFPKTKDNPKLTLFNDTHAKEILKFVELYENIVGLTVCQCEAGISRSAGIAGALSKIYNDNDAEFFKRYLPNRYVYRGLLNYYYRKDK